MGLPPVPPFPFQPRPHFRRSHFRRFPNPTSPFTALSHFLRSQIRRYPISTIHICEFFCVEFGSILGSTNAEYKHNFLKTLHPIDVKILDFVYGRQKNVSATFWFGCFKQQSYKLAARMDLQRNWERLMGTAELSLQRKGGWRNWERLMGTAELSLQRKGGWRNWGRRKWERRKWGHASL